MTNFKHMVQNRLIFFPIFNVHSKKLPLNNDHMSISTINLESWGLPLKTGSPNWWNFGDSSYVLLIENFNIEAHDHILMTTKNQIQPTDIIFYFLQLFNLLDTALTPRRETTGFSVTAGANTGERTVTFVWREPLIPFAEPTQAHWVESLASEMAWLNNTSVDSAEFSLTPTTPLELRKSKLFICQNQTKNKNKSSKRIFLFTQVNSVAYWLQSVSPIKASLFWQWWFNFKL